MRLPFAMEPVVYDFRINPHGTMACLKEGRDAVMPSRYYSLQVGAMIAEGAHGVESHRKADIDHFANGSAETGELLRVFRTMINEPLSCHEVGGRRRNLRRPGRSGCARIRTENGFSPRAARLAPRGPAARLDRPRPKPAAGCHRDRDVQEDSDLIRAGLARPPSRGRAGEEAIVEGRSRSSPSPRGWGVDGRQGGSRQGGQPVRPDEWGSPQLSGNPPREDPETLRPGSGSTVPHVVTTSYLTHSAIDRHLPGTGNLWARRPGAILSRGQSIAQRLVPMRRDLTFLWEAGAREVLDENKQKGPGGGTPRGHGMGSVTGRGERLHRQRPVQRFNPPGHFYEVARHASPNWCWLVELLDRVTSESPPAHGPQHRHPWGQPRPHVQGWPSGRGHLGFEVIARRVDDRGGGLARVGGRMQTP